MTQDPKLICFRCRQPIEVPDGYNRAAAVLKHWWSLHPEVIPLIDRKQFALQNPQAEIPS
jgi:hypothetical protein